MPKKQRKAKQILGEGCGGLDGGKCLECGTNSRRSADVWEIHPGSNIRKRISERARESKKNSHIPCMCMCVPVAPANSDNE